MNHWYKVPITLNPNIEEDDVNNDDDDRVTDIACKVSESADNDDDDDGDADDDDDDSITVIACKVNNSANEQQLNRRVRNCPA